jgi:N-acetylmuramoyl-L-alanine amidase
MTRPDGGPHDRENALIRFVGIGLVSATAACLLTLSGSADAQVQLRTLPQTQSITVRAAVTQSAGKMQSQAFALAMATPSPTMGDLAPMIPVVKVYGPPLGQAPTTPVAPAVTQAAVPGAVVADLASLVATYIAGDVLDEEGACLATAVYFEARGETLDGQLAVAQVVMNRAQSGRYPTSWCAVVKQRAQFSFVRAGGRFPAIRADCPQWARAQAIARIATKRLVASLSPDVLWYHANYVAPSWGRRLNRVSQIGAHIFYRG